MIILEGPYVSDHLLEYLEKEQIPVLKNQFATNACQHYHLFLLEEEAFIQSYEEKPNLYLTSENALDWVYEKLSHSPIVSQLEWIKHKGKFRELIKGLYPDFFFETLSFENLRSYDIQKLPFPVVLKPAVGFFSVGVYVIKDETHWYQAIDQIEEQMRQKKSTFPTRVVDLQEFVIESYIEGTEYAIDAYYNQEGNPVILNIFTHRFTSKEDVSDRIYYTSKEIIETYKTPFESFLKQMNEKLQLVDFPMHVEIRVSSKEIIPIEVNPMRFAGLSCTDMAYYAYGINTVDYYLNHKVPDFKTILREKEHKLFSLIVLDKKQPDLSSKQFNYEKLIGDFNKVIKLRPVDQEDLNIFGFVFVETEEGKEAELDHILYSDLMEYMK